MKDIVNAIIFFLYFIIFLTIFYFLSGKYIASAILALLGINIIIKNKD